MVQKLPRLEATISDPTIHRLGAEASALELEYRMPSLGRDMPQDKVAALDTAKRPMRRATPRLVARSAFSIRQGNSSTMTGVWLAITMSLPAGHAPPVPQTPAD